MRRYGSLRHPARPEPAPAGHTVRAYGSNARTAVVDVFAPHPVARAMASALHLGTSLISPSVSGRFRGGDKGAPVNRGNADTGALQVFRGAYSAGQAVRLGAQSGPSSQPGYPATNNVVLSALANTGLPDIMRLKV